MNDQDLRALVRHLVTQKLAGRYPAPSAAVPQGEGERSVHIGPSVSAGHPSHDIYITLVNTGETCVIEPGASCNHCDYCKSHGH